MFTDKLSKAQVPHNLSSSTEDLTVLPTLGGSINKLSSTDKQITTGKNTDLSEQQKSRSADNVIPLLAKEKLQLTEIPPYSISDINDLEDDAYLLNPVQSQDPFSLFIQGHTSYQEQGLSDWFTSETFSEKLTLNSIQANLFFPTHTTVKPFKIEKQTLDDFAANYILRAHHYHLAVFALLNFGLQPAFQSEKEVIPSPRFDELKLRWLEPEGIEERALLKQIIMSLALLSNQEFAKSIADVTSRLLAASGLKTESKKFAKLSNTIQKNLTLTKKIALAKKPEPDFPPPVPPRKRQTETKALPLPPRRSPKFALEKETKFVVEESASKELQTIIKDRLDKRLNDVEILAKQGVIGQNKAVFDQKLTQKISDIQDILDEATLPQEDKDKFSARISAIFILLDASSTAPKKPLVQTKPIFTPAIPIKEQQYSTRQLALRHLNTEIKNASALKLAMPQLEDQERTAQQQLLEQKVDSIQVEINYQLNAGVINQTSAQKLYKKIAHFQLETKQATSMTAARAEAIASLDRQLTRAKALAEQTANKAQREQLSARLTNLVFDIQEEISAATVVTAEDKQKFEHQIQTILFLVQQNTEQLRPTAAQSGALGAMLLKHDFTGFNNTCAEETLLFMADKYQIPVIFDIKNYKKTKDDQLVLLDIRDNEYSIENIPIIFEESHATNKVKTFVHIDGKTPQGIASMFAKMDKDLLYLVRSGYQGRKEEGDGAGHYSVAFFEQGQWWRYDSPSLPILEMTNKDGTLAQDGIDKYVSEYMPWGRAETALAEARKKVYSIQCVALTPKDIPLIARGINRYRTG